MKPITNAVKPAVTLFHAKPPKKWKSWRVCPKCGSRATKIYNLNTGRYRCQDCGAEYLHPDNSQ